MTNLNTEITALLTAAQDAGLGDSWTAALGDVAARYATSQLTAEELAISAPTIERLEIEQTLDDYHARAGGLYTYTTGERTRPVWLVRASTDDATYQQLLAGLASPEAQPLVTQMSADGYPDPTGLQQLVTRRTAVQAEEQMAAGARDKVRSLVDLRAGLMGILRISGMTGESIQALRATPAA